MSSPKLYKRGGGTDEVQVWSKVQVVRSRHWPGEDSVGRLPGNGGVGPADREHACQGAAYPQMVSRHAPWEARLESSRRHRRSHVVVVVAA